MIILCSYAAADKTLSALLQLGTYIMLGGQPFAFAAGWAATWLRLFQSERIAMRFKEAKAAGVLRVRHRFHDAYEVEICAR